MNSQPRLAQAALVGTLVALTLLPAAGCGRRGAPRPPEDVLPETITRLAARNEHDGVVLTWPRPERYTGGGKMNDLGEFAVERSSAAGESPTFMTVARIPVLDRDRFRQVKNFRFTDREIEACVTYRYRIVSSTTDGYVSAPSNEVEITRPANE